VTSCQHHQYQPSASLSCLHNYKYNCICSFKQIYDTIRYDALIYTQTHTHTHTHHIVSAFAHSTEQHSSIIDYKQSVRNSVLALNCKSWCNNDNLSQQLLTVITVLSISHGHQFLRATAHMLSAHMLSQFRLSVRPSVRPSVTRVDQSKTVEVRIMQFSPYSNPIPLVFVR